jgi:hypothetical protein
VRLDSARRHALSLPETTEAPHFEASSFRVGGKIFATIPPDGKRLRLLVDPAERHALVAANPSAFGDVRWGQRTVDDWVEVIVANANRAEVCELLTDAWRRRAPKRLVADFDARCG